MTPPLQSPLPKDEKQLQDHNVNRLNRPGCLILPIDNDRQKPKSVVYRPPLVCWFCSVTNCTPSSNCCPFFCADIGNSLSVSVVLSPVLVFQNHVATYLDLTYHHCRIPNFFLFRSSKMATRLVYNEVLGTQKCRINTLERKLLINCMKLVLNEINCEISFLNCDENFLPSFWFQK